MTLKLVCRAPRSSLSVGEIQRGIFKAIFGRIPLLNHHLFPSLSVMSSGSTWSQKNIEPCGGQLWAGPNGVYKASVGHTLKWGEAAHQMAKHRRIRAQPVIWTQSYRWLATLRGQPSFIGSKGSAATSLSRSSLFGSEGQTSCTHYPHPGFFRGEKISITLWREKWHCALPRSSWLKVLAIDVLGLPSASSTLKIDFRMWHRAVCVCCFQSSNQHVVLGFISSTHSSSICPFVQGPNPRVQVVDSGREPPNCKRHSEGHQSCFYNPWWSIVAVPSSECLWAFSLQEVLQTDSSSTSLRVAVHRAKGIEYARCW